MPKGYHHLTYDQRCQIYALKKSDLSQNKIAKLIGVSQSTVSKELIRNKGQKGYRYKQAHERAVSRRREASLIPSKMTSELISMIEKMLTIDQLSQEQISGRLKLKNKIEISLQRIIELGLNIDLLKWMQKHV